MSVKQRFYYIDALRVLALFLIILYHYETDIVTSGLFDIAAAGIGYETVNIHMAKVGVNLFFMVSGFGLMLASLYSFSVKEYVKKRVVRIYLPFYAVTLLVYLAKRVQLGSAVFAGIPMWHVIYTLLGLDGYLAEYGVATFSLGVGEWFVGCIIGMYVCFPMLRWVMQKKPNVTIGAATIGYIIIDTVYEGMIPAHYFFFIKIYDFILGMYLAIRLQRICQNKEKALRLAVLSALGAVFFLILPVKIQTKSEYVHSVFCLLVFLCAFWLESVPFVQRMFASGPISIISKYSYEMFLLHHWGLIVMNRRLKPQGVEMFWLCFIFEFMIILAGGMILKECINWGLRKSMQKKLWNKAE